MSSPAAAGGFVFVPRNDDCRGGREKQKAKSKKQGPCRKFEKALSQMKPLPDSCTFLMWILESSSVVVGPNKISHLRGSLRWLDRWRCEVKNAASAY